MFTLAIAASAGHASATNPSAGLLPRLRRRAQWALPMIGWNAGMLYLNTVAHSPILAAMTLGSLAVAAIVAVSEPDDLEA